MPQNFLKWGLLAMVVVSAAAMGAVLAGAAVWAEILIGILILITLAVGAGQLFTAPANVKATPPKHASSKNVPANLPPAPPDAFTTHELVQSLCEALPLPVALVDSAGIIQMANARGARMGLEAGKQVHQLPHRQFKSLLEEAFMSGKRVAPQDEVAQVRWMEDGRERCFMPAAVPLTDGSGKILALAVMLEEKVAAGGTAEEPQEGARSKLLSSFSHDLKTPLTSIQMAIHLLIEDAATQLSPRQMELLRAARDDVDRLHQLVEEILATARRKW